MTAHFKRNEWGGIVLVQTTCAAPGCKVLVDEPGALCPVCAEKDRHARRAETVDDGQRRLFA